jgi:phage replication-related protein YjqB (UPF0714/DUF867 family)
MFDELLRHPGVVEEWELRSPFGFLAIHGGSLERGTAEVAADAAEQERQEQFIAEKVREGESVDGLFPLGPKWQAAYDEWKASR